MSDRPVPPPGAGTPDPEEGSGESDDAGGPAVPPALIRFAELFDREDFWESHEVLEGPWREQGSAFYQGLILYASAFVHVQRNNAHGVTAQLRKAERALAPFAPHYLGVDVDAVLRNAKAVRERVEAARAGNDAPDGIPFPRLPLDPGRIRGDEPELGGPA